MITFTGSATTTASLRRSAAEAAAGWVELDRQARCRSEAASAEPAGPLRLQVRLKEMNHGSVKFSGRYTLVFTVDAGVADSARVSWRSEAGSDVAVEGEARFRPAAGGCTVTCTERVTVPMELNALIGRALRPIVEAMIERGSRGFVERMVASLDGGA